jgi:hypothetical protein
MQVFTTSEENVGLCLVKNHSGFIEIKALI